jgi:putative transposase
MPQSLSKVIIHIIFSTKDREGWLDRDVRPRMHAYVATVCRDLNAEALRVGDVSAVLLIIFMLLRPFPELSLKLRWSKR